MCKHDYRDKQLNNNRAAGYTEVIQNLNGTTDLINLIKTIDEQKRVYIMMCLLEQALLVSLMLASQL